MLAVVQSSRIDCLSNEHIFCESIEILTRVLLYFFKICIHFVGFFFTDASGGECAENAATSSICNNSPVTKRRVFSGYVSSVYCEFNRLALSCRSHRTRTRIEMCRFLFLKNELNSTSVWLSEKLIEHVGRLKVNTSITRFITVMLFFSIILELDAFFIRFPVVRL